VASPLTNKAKATLVRAELTSLRTVGIDTFHSSRFTALLMPQT